MTLKAEGFKRLLISYPASQTVYGRDLLAKFKAKNLEVRVFEQDSSVLKDPLIRKSSSLVALERPEDEWVTKADFGILSVRKNEFYLHPIIGCRYGCTYCYLLARDHGRLPLRLHLNVSDLTNCISEVISNNPEPSEILFSTGELADSLADVSIYPIAPLLVSYFSTNNNAKLELRTKSDNVDCLLKLTHNERTTVSFSISPPNNIAKYELRTMILDSRLRAARKCQDAGYLVALNLEPIIMSENWVREYDEMIASIGKILDLKRIEHLTLGCLRWNEKLAQTSVFSRVYHNQIQQADLIEYRKGKVNGTIEFNHRIKIYQTLKRSLREIGIESPIWVSLESGDILSTLGIDIE